MHDLHDFGTVYYHFDALANAFYLADVEDSGIIRYSSYSLRQSNFHELYMETTIILSVFQTGNAHQLYSCDMSQYAREHLCIVNVSTVYCSIVLYAQHYFGDAR